MGMYTTLKCEMILKEEYVEGIQNLQVYQTTWKDILGDCRFANLYRASFIPNGGLTYSSYEDDKYKTLEGNHWSFICSLKDYQGEIRIFWEEVVPIIAEEVLHFEYWYEESPKPTVIVPKRSVS